MICALLLRLLDGRNEQLNAVISDSRTPTVDPEWHRADHDGANALLGIKVHMAVDTLGHLERPASSPCHEQERAQVENFDYLVQQITLESVEAEGSRLPPGSKQPSLNTCASA